MGQIKEQTADRTEGTPTPVSVCVCVSHRAPLTQAAQQQCRVRGHDAILHVLPGVLQSCEEEATL